MFSSTTYSQRVPTLEEIGTAVNLWQKQIIKTDLHALPVYNEVVASIYDDILAAVMADNDTDRDAP